VAFDIAGKWHVGGSSPKIEKTMQGEVPPGFFWDFYKENEQAEKVRCRPKPRRRLTYKDTTADSKSQENSLGYAFRLVYAFR
jgi:hypothetical protein